MRPVLCRELQKALDKWKKGPPSNKMEMRSGNCKPIEGGRQKNDNNSLAHTSWNCSTIIVFAPKSGLKILCRSIGQRRERYCENCAIGKCKDNRDRNLRRPCTYVCRNTTENECIKFHGFFERKNSVIFHERHGNRKYKYGNRSATGVTGGSLLVISWDAAYPPQDK